MSIHRPIRALRAGATALLLAVPVLAQATVIELQNASAFSFQDEGTTNIDQTAQLQTLDGDFAPDPVGTVDVDYYATGTSDRFFDGISMTFDLASVGFANVAGATLRFFTQKGAYESFGGSASANRNAWEHYAVLQGAFNATDEDLSPVGAGAAPSAIDFFASGTAAADQTVGWIESSVDVSWITSDSLDLTLRLWNARIDRIELVVDTATVPAPAPIALLLLGLGGLLGRRALRSH